jgi:hypothetical protein
MHETQRSDAIGNFRQGDILRFEGLESTRNYSRGIVINADCDLENNKLDGVIAYLPLYSFQEYLEHFWLQNYVDQIRKSLISRIFDLCSLDRSNLANIEDLFTWMDQSPPDEIAAKLVTQHCMKPREGTELKEKLTKLRHCRSPLGRSLAGFHVYCSWEKDPVAFALKQLTAAKTAMGDDHFFINEVVGEKEIGFVVRMRRIYTIDAQQCFTLASAQRTKSDEDVISAFRIAKLTDLFQFKVAQVFALQYSRIGLPNEFASLNGLVLDTMAFDLSKGAV